ncbi:MAG: glycerol-3-phosphate 1-O-acyltransferase PlsY [Bacillota bacterium]
MFRQAGLLFLAIPAGYLLGSVAVGLIVAKITGVDIRKKGSGNIGATNVFRTVGKLQGLSVFIGDALKGYLGAWIGESLAGDWGMIAAGFAAVLGHNYSIFLKGEGGKGISTTCGVILKAMPLALPFLIPFWAAIIFVTGYVSLGSICAALALPAAGYFLYHDAKLTVMGTALAAMAIWRHKGNIRRLLRGEENCFRKKHIGGNDKQDA